MEWIINAIKEGYNWVVSLEGIGTVTLGSILTFVIQNVLKNRSLLKANAKYNALSTEYKKFKDDANKSIEFFKKSAEQYQLILDDVYDIAIKLNENAKAQNEAMLTAFNSSNLNYSAKKEVEKYLKPIITTVVQEDEIKKDVSLPISNAVNEVVPNEVVENEQQKIIRIK
jgi:PIN domain nuclease of toxin-antitoxin system